VTLRPLVGLGVAALALTGLVGCSSSSSASGSAPFKVSGAPVQTDHVEMVKAYQFSPAVIEVKAGTTVTWTNHDDFPHNVTLVTGPDKTAQSVGIGQAATIPFAQPGTVYYQCTLHPQQMRGKVVVT
jgi:plastocyanin